MQGCRRRRLSVTAEQTRWASLPAALLALSACASEDSTLAGPKGSRAVSQAGAQDIAYFRQVLNAGEVPERASFDQLGFFAEHALDQPAATCGSSVCVHPQLAVAPRFDGGNWTMAFASLNTALDAESLQRAPLHLALVVEHSALVADARRPVQVGIERLLAALPEGDRVTYVAFGATAEVLYREQPANAATAPGHRSLDQQVALYDALALAIDALTQPEEAPADAQVLLVTSGHATAGVTDEGRLTALAEAAARSGIGLAIVGTGSEYDPTLPQGMTEGAGGTLTYASGGEVDGVLAAQAELALVPLATEFELRVVPRAGYAAQESYGAARAQGDEAAVVLQAPALFLGARTGSRDVDEDVGRRGGGGGLFVRLNATSESAAIGGGEPAFAVEVRYLDRQSGRRVEEVLVVDNALPPGENPAENWPHFSDEAHGKPFMMLNMYLAIDNTLELYEQGLCNEALGLIDMMQPAIVGWQERYDDPDTAADAALLEQLRANIDRQCVLSPTPPAEIRASCFIT